MSANDKDLLELAAKAAGVALELIEVKSVTAQDDNRFIGYMTKPDQWPRGWFNPLTDDGDALRLAVKLRLDIFTFGAADSSGEYGALVQNMSDTVEEDVPHNGDPYAATRRAIVRAAAEIGRMM